MGYNRIQQDTGYYLLASYAKSKHSENECVISQGKHAEECGGSDITWKEKETSEEPKGTGKCRPTRLREQIIILHSNHGVICDMKKLEQR